MSMPSSDGYSLGLFSHCTEDTVVLSAKCTIVGIDDTANMSVYIAEGHIRTDDSD